MLAAFLHDKVFSEFNTTITTLRDNYLEFNRLSVAIRAFFIATYYHFIATKQRKWHILRRKA